ncbi:MAG TPA: DUF5069 domain-containing protein [Terrimicrobiaceae bacterium]|nr:DUF5069 domain-containing protein [Terrimicrobiaceae bacterium]
MLNPPFRSPRKKVGGLYHFGRMIDKIRLHLREELPEEYRPNFGLSAGLDGHLCGFLGVSHSDLVQQVRLGKTDDEIAEWCFSNGLRPNSIQRRIWNGFAEKFGWRDVAAPFMERVKIEEGLVHRDDLVTAFDLMDGLEGR